MASKIQKALALTKRYKVLKWQAVPVHDTDILNYVAKNTLPPHYKYQLVDAFSMKIMNWTTQIHSDGKMQSL
jgi:hypothetical protein